MSGPHVFGDGRVGLWVVNPANLNDRLPKIKAYRGGQITDVFLPLVQSTASDAGKVKQAGLFAQGTLVGASLMSADAFADLAIQRIAQVGTGALEANIELPNDALYNPYIRTFMGRFRATRPNYRVRVNIPWRKGGFLPVDLFQEDPNLYVDEQSYFDPPGSTMHPASQADALENLLDAGVPIAKASVCYGAAGPVGGITGTQRVSLLPEWAPSRGIIFQDDLMVEAGLL